ncbi:hypothetical protein RF11_05311 [Thelohanellus kitauei]|uniref:Uncharacterized protein n=1 Tax=Thelohanellus kitauei TaxID=669202 RepID=A0A0C2I8U9_THEKT|nr:hypothetical protein RF11_05311 [Thelohanellus kitauei]
MFSNIFISVGDERCRQELVKFIKILIKYQQEQTQALIQSQQDQLRMLNENMTRLFSNSNLLPAFEHFDCAKEEFGSYHKRIEHHFSSDCIIHEMDKKSHRLSYIVGATFSLLEKLVANAH